MTRQSDAVTKMLAARTGTQPADWFLVHKARYGMQVVFAALADLRGVGDVVTQVLTCCTAVDPVLVAGLRPVYAEVSPDSVAIDPERLALGGATRAVVLQNTFGLVDDERAALLRERAHGAGALLVEDSAHCVGTLARDDDGAPVADVSIHSFGAEKMLPTRFGGAVWVNPQLRDRTLRDRLVCDLVALPVAGARRDLAARLYVNELRVLNRLPKAVSGPVRDVLTATGACDPPVAPVERRGRLAAPASAPSPWVVAQMGAALPSLADVEAGRAAAVREYVRALAGAVQVPAAVGAGRPLVRFPFFASDAAAAERIFAAVSAAGFYAGRWYRPALFPGVVDPAAYGYVPGDGSLETTEDLIERVVNLPTGVDVADARRIADIVLSTIG